MGKSIEINQYIQILYPEILLDTECQFFLVRFKDTGYKNRVEGKLLTSKTITNQNNLSTTCCYHLFVCLFSFILGIGHRMLSHVVVRVYPCGKTSTEL